MKRRSAKAWQLTPEIVASCPATLNAIADVLGHRPKAALCWLCFLDHIETRLDTASRCSIHGLVKDRVLGMIRVDVNLLKHKPVRTGEAT